MSSHDQQQPETASHRPQSNARSVSQLCSASTVVAFVAGIVLAMLYFSLVTPMPVATTTANAAPSPHAAVTLTTLRRPSSSSSSHLTLGSAFACQRGGSSNNSSSSPCFYEHPVRISWIGDSVTYGNGTHVGDLHAPPFKQGNWPFELTELLRRRADRVCRGSPFRSTTDSTMPTTTDNDADGDDRRLWFSFDARNFAVPKTSTTCTMNLIQHTPQFQQALAFRPHVIFLLLGTNDCSTYCAGFTAARFYNMYAGIIRAFQQRSARYVVLVTPPPMVNSSFVHRYKFNFTAIGATIVPVVRRLARDFHLPLVDLHAEWAEKIDFRRFRPYLLREDGLHPTLLGHTLIAKLVDKFVCSAKL